MSPAGQMTINNFHWYLKRIPWPILLSCRMMGERRTSSGTRISCAGFLGVHWKWCVLQYSQNCGLVQHESDKNLCLIGCITPLELSSITDIHDEQVQMQIEAHFVNDILRGNDITEMRITLLRYLDDEMPPDDE